MLDVVGDPKTIDGDAKVPTVTLASTALPQSAVTLA